jgi:hypothetical protein
VTDLVAAKSARDNYDQTRVDARVLFFRRFCS